MLGQKVNLVKMFVKNSLLQSPPKENFCIDNGSVCRRGKTRGLMWDSPNQISALWKMFKLKQSSWLSLHRVERERRISRKWFILCLLLICLILLRVAFKKCLHLSTDCWGNTNRLRRKVLAMEGQVCSIPDVRVLIGVTQWEWKAVACFVSEESLERDPEYLVLNCQIQNTKVY